MSLFSQFVLSVFLFQDREALEREFNRILITLNSQTEYIDRWVDFFFTHTANRISTYTTRNMHDRYIRYPRKKIKWRYLLFWLQFENRPDKTRRGKWHGSGQYHSGDKLCRNSDVEIIFQLSRVKSMNLILTRSKIVFPTGLQKPWKRQEPFEQRQSVSGRST